MRNFVRKLQKITYIFGLYAPAKAKDSGEFPLSQRTRELMLMHWPANAAQPGGYLIFHHEIWRSFAGDAGCA